jgi:polar amino acid transport system permease protein
MRRIVEGAPRRTTGGKENLDVTRGGGAGTFPAVIETWRDLVLAPGGARGEASPPALAKVLNTLLAILLLIAAVWFSLVSLNYNWGWASVWTYREMLFKGWLVTLGVASAALVLSTLGGFLLALGQRSYLLPLRYFAKVLVEIVRCTPLLVLILLIWYGFGGVFGIGNDYRFLAGIFILTLFESAYISEIMRAGIESVGRTQIESARAIGLTRAQTYRYVIIPQAVRQVMPPLVGQLVSLIKDSSLLSIISITEFTESAQQVSSITYSNLETYLPLAGGYLVLTVPIALWSRWLERRFKYET